MRIGFAILVVAVPALLMILGARHCATDGDELSKSRPSSKSVDTARSSGAESSAAQGEGADTRAVPRQGARNTARQPVAGTTGRDDTKRRPFSFDEFDESESPSREFVRAAIEAAVAERFTSHRLSSDEVERAADAMVQLRETQEALRSLPVGPETAEERRILVERIGQSTSNFRDVLDMDPAEFTREASPSVGIDRFDPEEDVPEPVFIERAP